MVYPFVKRCEKPLKSLERNTYNLPLCYFHIQENEEFTKILRENQRIICLFRGHTHINEVLRPESWRGKLLVDIGGYGYMGRNEGGRWIFNTFDAAWAWGYQVLVWDQTHVHIYM